MKNWILTYSEEAAQKAREETRREVAKRYREREKRLIEKARLETERKTAELVRETERKTARKMKEQKLPVDQIALVSGFSPAEIAKL
jgi:predicted transposase YdaD